MSDGSSIRGGRSSGATSPKSKPPEKESPEESSIYFPLTDGSPPSPPPKVKKAVHFGGEVSQPYDQSLEAFESRKKDPTLLPIYKYIKLILRDHINTYTYPIEIRKAASELYKAIFKDKGKNPNSARCATALAALDRSISKYWHRQSKNAQSLRQLMKVVKAEIAAEEEAGSIPSTVAAHGSPAPTAAAAHNHLEIKEEISPPPAHHAEEATAEASAKHVDLGNLKAKLTAITTAFTAIRLTGGLSTVHIVANIVNEQTQSLLQHLDQLEQQTNGAERTFEWRVCLATVAQIESALTGLMRQYSRDDTTHTTYQPVVDAAQSALREFKELKREM